MSGRSRGLRQRGGFYVEHAGGLRGTTYSVVGTNNELWSRADAEVAGRLTTLNAAALRLQFHYGGIATIRGAVDEPTTTVAARLACGPARREFRGLVTRHRTDR